MRKLEVRCCCNANKVLGHLAHPRLQKGGDAWWFVLEHTPLRRIELTVDRVGLGSGQVIEAIKNRDYPLEDLKRIPGFEPATWEP